MVVPYFTRHAKNALSCCTSMTFICANNHEMNGFFVVFFLQNAFQYYVLITVPNTKATVMGVRYVNVNVNHVDVTRYF